MALIAPTVLAVTTMQKSSGIERDAVVNTWHYQNPSPPSSQDFGNWANNWKAFMGAISTYLSANLSNGSTAWNVSMWQIPISGQGPLGAPIVAMDLAGASNQVATGLPGEVSICLSMQGSIVGVPEAGAGGTRPASRRRNRVFLGPFNTTTLAEDPTTKDVGPSAVVRTAIVDAYKLHMVQDQIADNWRPVVFSRANWDTHPVVTAWVDNAFDTQRRRGPDPTAKTIIQV